MAIISAIISIVKGAGTVIRYAPLWKTMDKQEVTTYTLRFKHGMSHATVQRLQADMPVSTHTLNKLCTILDCRLEDVAEYIPDKEND
jgi:DNA-binding Xre family transcriptional regulator